MDLGLTDRRALVTGGSRGIGLAVGRALAREGADVALLARGAEGVERAAAEVARESGRRVIGVAADTGDDESVQAAVAAVVERVGGVDILVNAAATPNTGPPLPDDALEAEINVKVRGYLRCARAVAPLMVAGGWGRIVNIGGLAARQSGTVVGSVRNVAVAAMTKNLADELGAQGVNVTVVHPGMTRTEQPLDPELERRAAGRVSIGRIVTAAEVADVVTFLASPRSVALNGDAVVASGGARGPIYY
jgi:NAD(P)-dependent dehydrogenase (short-subunit alcohol dehydrogenase family)